MAQHYPLQREDIKEVCETLESCPEFKRFLKAKNTDYQIRGWDWGEGIYGYSENPETNVSKLPKENLFDLKEGWAVMFRTFGKLSDYITNEELVKNEPYINSGYLEIHIGVDFKIKSIFLVL